MLPLLFGHIAWVGCKQIERMRQPPFPQVMPGITVNTLCRPKKQRSAIGPRATVAAHLHGELEREGHVLLPGLTAFIEDLNPLTHDDVWAALKTSDVRTAIFAHPLCKRQYWMLNDERKIDEAPQAALDFVAKENKSHLTVVSGTEEFLDSPLLPERIRNYFGSIYQLLRFVEQYLTDILPKPTLPALLKFRAFHYDHSDLLAGLRRQNQRPAGMRPHVDPSIVTLVIAHSDGLLKFLHNSTWQTASQSNGAPFALLIPGFAAAQDLALVPTPHFVASNGERRMSLTVFLTPDLGFGSRAEAEKRLGEWRLA